METKILGLVRSCGECPNHAYYSGVQYQCKLTERTVVDKSIVAPFCPLADFPSRKLADMDATIRVLREPNTYGFTHALMSHVATKLKTTLSDRCTVTFALENNEPLYLFHDHITKIETFPWTIHFVCGERAFRLHPDSHPPDLYESVKVEGFEKPMWRHCKFA